MLRPDPTTARDWHVTLAGHLGHELLAHNCGQLRQRIVVQCVADDGRASLSTRPEDSPESEAQWRPHVSARLFFAGRSVACRDCCIPLAH